MDIPSPWHHRVHKKESEKVEKSLKREIRKLWGIRRVKVVPAAVGVVGAGSKRLHTWLDKLGITINTDLLQNSFVGSSKNLKVEGGKLTHGNFGHWL